MYKYRIKSDTIEQLSTIKYNRGQEEHMIAMTEQPLLTVPEVAARLRVPEAAVRGWLREGKLRGYLPGGRRTGWRISEADLQRFLDQSANRPEEA
jgi:excisionase family DNA binding protein